MEKEIINSYATQLRLDAPVVLMRDIIQKASNTDKQKPLSLRPSVWLSYLLSVNSISVGVLSIFSIAAIGGIKPARANISDVTANLPEGTPQEEAANTASSCSNEYDCFAGTQQEPVEEEALPTVEQDVQTIEGLGTGDWEDFDPTSLAKRDRVASVANPHFPEDRHTNTFSAFVPPQTEEALVSNSVESASHSSFALEDDWEVGTGDGENSDLTSSANPQFLEAEDWGLGTRDRENSYPTSIANPHFPEDTPTNTFSAFAPPQTDEAPVSNSLESNSHSLLALEGDGELKTGNWENSYPTSSANLQFLEAEDWELEGANTRYRPYGDGENSDPTSIANLQFLEDRHTNTFSAFAPPQTEEAPVSNSVESNSYSSWTLEQQPTLVAQTVTSSPTEEEAAPYSGPGGASLLGGTIRAQSSTEGGQEPASVEENTQQEIDPLAPSLVFQGGVIVQDAAGARARVTGLYPISPNALFGGTVDLTTGEGFSDTEETGLDINELYFTGSLPSYPNLRLTVGMMDLTSYFDRNSFAKDSLTHFFNPVFQTNPALAAAGIGSRPGALLNWDVNDNIQARAAVFSSDRSLGDFDLNAFAGEVAFRAGNAIVRGTFSTNKDAGRNSGFEEIFGIPRDNGEFGIDSDDRENAYGINAEYFIPQINMGLFARYGRYENTSLDEGGDTYSLGLNFLDLFMPTDRLGFGYGRNLSNNDLRRDNGNKTPDVWEVFYDFRLSPNFRAGVTLQARDEFSDIVAGFRVKTEFDLLRLGRIFR